MAQKHAFSVLAETKNGEFVRKDTVCRDWVKADGSTKYAPEAGRYHLYVANACPWANRITAIRKMKGLEDVIGLSIVGPFFQKTSTDPDDHHRGWTFEDPEAVPGTIPDTVYNCKFLRDIYNKLDPSVEKYTTPMLVDIKNNTIVNNESSELLRMLNSEFNSLAKNPDLDLCPSNLMEEIEKVNTWVYSYINNGVYRCGFATSQEAYDKASAELFEHLDKAEEILSKQRYLASNDHFTEADLRLFMTLVRFDPVYHLHFKCSKTPLREYPNLWNYTLEIYQMQGVGETVHMGHVIEHYYRSHTSINTYGIIPLLTIPDYTVAHDRARF